MKYQSHSFEHLTNQQLLAEVKALAGREREATVRLIASLAELDLRRLYLGEGYSSLFTYCTQCLRLSEHAAYGRIEAARAAARFPLILDGLADGSLTLTTVCLLAPHLTSENHQAVLDAARHKSRREVEQQVAALRPLPSVPSSVRKLPAQQPCAAPHPQIALVDAGTSRSAGSATELTTDRPRPPRPVRRILGEGRRGRRRSPRLLPSGTKCNSRSVATHTTSCDRCKICCGTRCPMAIRRRSSIVR